MLNDLQIRGSSIRPTVLIAILAVISVIAASVYYTLHLAKIQQQHELSNWQARLDIIANARLTNVNNWLEGQIEEISSVATTPSLQIYMTELEQYNGDKAKVTDEPYQATYLRNLLKSTAARLKYSGNNTQTINANVKEVQSSGLILLDKKNQIITSSSLVDTLPVYLQNFIDQRSSNIKETHISDIYKGINNQPSIAFISPVFSIQGDINEESRVGSVIAYRTVHDSLFPLLNQPNTVENTLETVLAYLDNENNIHYLSPLKDGTAALTKTIPATDNGLATVYAVQNVGKFALKKDYASHNVLVTSRQLYLTPWTLIHKIDRSEALANNDALRRNMMAICISFISLFTLALFAVWRHSSYLKESRSAAKYKQLAYNFEEQKNLLSLISDHKPEALFIVNTHNNVHFANLEAARQSEMTPEQMKGKSLNDIMGKGRADIYIDTNEQALSSKKTCAKIHTIQTPDGIKIIQSKHIYVPAIPASQTQKAQEGILILEQDITHPVVERDNNVRTLDNLTKKLVSLIDERDPNAANYSNRVARLAKIIAEQVQLSPQLIKTTETSALLMNLGKLFVPLTILQKSDKPTLAEQKILANARNTTVQILKDIEFDEDIVKTIEQSQENWDGSGPLNLKGNDILVTARIIHIANAFINMRSPKSYRSVINFEDTLKHLNEHSETQYDRAIVIALENYMENHGGKKEWQEAEGVEEALGV